MQQAPLFDENNPDSFDLLKYLVLLWHWTWLIVLAIVIAAVGAYYVSSIIPPVFQAKTTILVDMASSSSVDYGLVLLNSQRTQTYAQMITKAPVLSEVATKLGLATIDPKKITAKPVTNTQLIAINVNSNSPSLAADIANTIVTVFAEQVRTLETTRYSASEQSLQTQMKDIEDKIKDANDQLAATSDQAEKDRLETMIANYSQTYASLLQSYEQVRLAEAQTLSSIVQIEPATVPIIPIRPNTFLNIAISVIVSAVLAIFMVLVTDMLNNKIKTPDDITGKFGLPVLGVITHYRTNGEPITVSQSFSPTSEAFRALRTNIKYAWAGSEKPYRSLIITSAIPGEGKTDVLVNLGIVLSQSKQRVLLIDADLRRPTLHKRLGVQNILGLSQMFVHPDIGGSFSLQSTKYPNLAVITTGDTPPNPSELLGSPTMGKILEDLKNKYDLILIDTPPALVVTDAVVMMPYVDGVVIVTKPGSITMGSFRRLLTQFHQVNANVLGVVLNNINMRDSSYGYYYKNYRYDKDYKEKKASKPIFKKKTTKGLEQNNNNDTKLPSKVSYKSLNWRSKP